jgi:hypothetical protein
MYRTVVIAYVDDITITLRSPKDAAIVQEEKQIRGSIWTQIEHQQIQGNGLRFLVHCTKYTRDKISSTTARLRYTRDPDRPSILCHQLGDGNGQNKTPAKGWVLERSHLTPTDTVRTNLFDG